MGEIGIPTDTALYKLTMWQIVAIRRGYFRRINRMWEQTRYAAYWTLKSSMRDTSKITSPQDLFTLPEERDDEEKEVISDEEVERIRDEIRRYNEAHH